MNLNKLKIVGCGMIVFLITIFPLRLDAQISEAGQLVAVPFGGPVLAAIVCSCSANALVTFYDFRTFIPTQIIYQPGFSRVNNWFNLFTPGVMILGQYIPGGICMVTVTGSDCESVGAPFGTISSYPFAGVGTGLYPYVPATN